MNTIVVFERIIAEIKGRSIT